MRSWIDLCEAASRSDETGIRAKVAALSVEMQVRLADALTADMLRWVIGDGMVSGNNEDFVAPFELIGSVITHRRRRSLRAVYRGTKLDDVTPEIRAATNDGAHRLVTSTKALQSWSTSSRKAVEFATWQDYAQGEHGVLFATRASALDILLTTADVYDSLWAIVDALDEDVRDRYSSLSHSAFMDLHYRLEEFQGQNEVVARTPADGLVQIIRAKVLS